VTAVLVVGGAGFIGSHTCKALKKRGFIPVVYDNLQSGHAWAVKYGPFVRASLDDVDTLSQAFAMHKPQAVLHFASSINVRESVQQPGLYYRNNVSCSLNLLEAMRKHNTRHLVFSSSAAVYGLPSGPLSEDAPCSPTHPYGKSKWMVEQMIHDYEAAHGLRSVIFRYFNAAGADVGGELGEAHTPETHLIPLAIQAARLKETLTIFGDTHATPDGTAIRDYVHVADLAEAHVLAVEHLLAGGNSATLNLATGRGYSVKEVVAMVEKVCKQAVPSTIAPRNSSEPATLIATCHQAKTLLDWSPKYTDLETMVATAHHWYSAC